MKVPAPIITDLDEAALVGLVERLDQAPFQSFPEANAKAERRSAELMDKMLATGGTYGEVAGWLPFLNRPQDQVSEYLNATKDDLQAQIAIMHHVLDHWFAHGEVVPPYYPDRITVILRKAKRLDLELCFLRAYARHFISHSYGARSEKLNARIVKVLGAEGVDQLRP